MTLQLQGLSASLSGWHLVSKLLVFPPSPFYCTCYHCLPFSVFISTQPLALVLSCLSVFLCFFRCFSLFPPLSLSFTSSLRFKSSCVQLLTARRRSKGYLPTY